MTRATRSLTEGLGFESGVLWSWGKVHFGVIVLKGVRYGSVTSRAATSAAPAPGDPPPPLLLPPPLRRMQIYHKRNFNNVDLELCEEPTLQFYLLVNTR